jgi:pimeloyl-ACP methyl ester carboxylesterase
MRTHDARFAGLPGFAFDPHYLEWRGLRAHYLDEGQGKRTYLCLHGNPTWSYLYRRMIPPFVASGARVVAPDLIGFGRSDKPDDEALYTFDFHRRFLLEFIESRNLKNITLVVQDWGTARPDAADGDAGALERLLLMNTALATGDAPFRRASSPRRSYSKENPDLAVGKLLARACPHSPTRRRRPDTPFPDARYKAGVRASRRWSRSATTIPARRFPEGERLPAQRMERRGFMAIGATTRCSAGRDAAAARLDPGCHEPLVIESGGHFLQEWGDEVARWFLSQT